MPLISVTDTSTLLKHTVCPTSFYDLLRPTDPYFHLGNEKEVGEGIKQSGVPRHEIWVTSKLFNDDHHPDAVEPAIKKTLSDLGLDYLDLYLMHWVSQIHFHLPPYILVYATSISHCSQLEV